MTVTILFTPSSPYPLKHHHHHHSSRPTPPLRIQTISSNHHHTHHQTTTSPPPPFKAIKINKSLLNLAEATSDTELRAAACLRVRTFYKFKDQSFGIQDHKKYLVDREFEALKERIAGEITGFKRVSCINATLPLSQISNTTLDEDFRTSLQLTNIQEDRVVVGTLDVNQCLRLPDEITGMKPQGIGANSARAYLSNVCVATEFQRNGLAYALIAKSETVAQEWGISDLYVHVAVDNEAAKNLYLKSGFVVESDEPAWQARFLDRPRRILLWKGLPNTYDL